MHPPRRLERPFRENAASYGTDARIRKGPAEGVCPSLLDDHVVVRKEKKRPVRLSDARVQCVRLSEAVFPQITPRQIRLTSMERAGDCLRLIRRSVVYDDELSWRGRWVGEDGGDAAFQHGGPVVRAEDDRRCRHRWKVGGQFIPCGGPIER